MEAALQQEHTKNALLSLAYKILLASALAVLGFMATLCSGCLSASVVFALVKPGGRIAIAFPSQTEGLQQSGGNSSHLRQRSALERPTSASNTSNIPKLGRMLVISHPRITIQRRVWFESELKGRSCTKGQNTPQINRY